MGRNRDKYDAWGNLVWGSDAGSFRDRDRARFKGALWMGEGGPELYYMRNRWYETHTGRFLSEDPIGLAGGINLYVYAGNNPISGRDPTGLMEGADFDGRDRGRIYNDAVFGGSMTLELMGGGWLGLSAGSAIYSNTRCGGRIDVSAIMRLPNAEFMTELLYAVTALNETVSFTVPGAGKRPNGSPNSLHTQGMAGDIMSTGRGLRPQGLAFGLLLHFFINTNRTDMQLGWYSQTSTKSGFVHLGLGGTGFNLWGYFRVDVRMATGKTPTTQDVLVSFFSPLGGAR